VSGGSPPLLRVGGAAAARLIADQRRIVVTGAGGWLGLAALEMLHDLLGDAFERRVACFGASGRTLALRGGARIVQAPTVQLADLSHAPTLVLHFAFITQSERMTLSADDFVEANLALSRSVLGSLDAIGAEAVFLASSGAAYLADRGGDARSKELYGWLKQAAELDLEAWRRPRGRIAATARIFNLAGPYINRRSTYALAAFIADALASRPILVRADRPVFRSYTAIEQLVSVALGALTGPSDEAVRFDAASDLPLEMGDLALAVAETLGSTEGISRPAFDRDAPPDRYVGDPAAYLALTRELAAPAPGLAEQIRQTAAFMAEHPNGYATQTELAP
jgi:UDP-glucuronate decarboxylase